MTDLEELLESLTPESTPPRVDELRRLLDKRRRIRRLALGVGVAAVVVTVVAGLGLTARAPSRIDAGPASDVQVTSTTRLVTQPPVGSETTVEEQDEWEALIPTGDWSLDSLRSTVRLGGVEEDLFRAATPTGGFFGPFVVARFNQGLETRDYADGPPNYEEKETAGGVIVRLDLDNAPDLRTGIFLVEDGSVWISSYEISEDDLLTIIDQLTVKDGRIRTTAEALPADLRSLPTLNVGPQLVTQLTVSRTKEEQMWIQIHDEADAWLAIRGIRATQSDIEPIEINGRRGLVFVGDRDNWPGAILQVDDRFYYFEAPPWNPTSALLSTEDITALLEGLETRSETELVSDPELEPRAKIYEDWFTETPLPNNHGLDWLALGPPMNPTSEAQEIHQYFQCAWVGYWTETGDPLAIDQLLASNDWPTGKLNLEQFLTDEPDFFDPDTDLLYLSIDQVTDARNLETREQRSNSQLRAECSYALGIPT